MFIIDFLKGIRDKIFIVVLALSVFANIYFIFGKGIQIDRSVHTYQDQRQEQQQTVNTYIYKNSVVNGKYKWMKSRMGINEVDVFLNSLKPIEWSSAKIISITRWFSEDQVMVVFTKQVAIGK